MTWMGLLTGAGITGVSAVIVALVLLPWQRRKLQADTAKVGADRATAEATAAQILGNTAVALLAPARQEIARLENDLDRANRTASRFLQQLEQTREELDAARAEIQELRNTVAQMSKELEERHGPDGYHSGAQPHPDRP